MDPVIAEKVAARRRYNQVRHLGTLFRCVEAFAALCLVSWSSARLHAVATRLSADLLRHLLAVLLGPRFIFLLGNAIVLALFVLSCRRPASSSGGADIYDQFLARQRGVTPPRPLPPAPEPAEAAEKPEEGPVRREKARRVCRRSRSERMKRRRVGPELQRSVSEVSGKEAAAAAEKEASLEESNEGDEEEFRQMIESFIATQMKRIRREESVAGVVSSEAPRNVRIACL
ncbi:hypothetical protein Cni_G12579 [Canna indica]|uniref:DUF4408 domain-containing protein n=1 Tax=Canna indica TaxID=4628 RepID=A0AAQ3K9N1_9LILI|nr:hypothetical protein Cni_G12579 [Canna indica]